MASHASDLPIAITVGDGAGIGPEIIARAFAEHADALRGCVVVGDVNLMQRAVEITAHAHPKWPAPFVEMIDTTHDIKKPMVVRRVAHLCPNKVRAKRSRHCDCLACIISRP